MPRPTGTWLSGIGSDGVTVRPAPHRGRRFGLPADGVGSVAPFGSRAAAFVVDALASALVAGLVNVVSTPTDSTRSWAGLAVLAVELLLSVALTGQSFGMWLLGLRVLRPAASDGSPGFGPALVRTVLQVGSLGLLSLIGPDGRGLHDHAAGTVVVRAR
jgi:uncharacterized RDD family membrane protein YckC